MIPVYAFAVVSIDAIRDTMGIVPEEFLLAGAQIKTTDGGAGRGRRPYFLCPACGRRALLLYVGYRVGRPACRFCSRVAYAGNLLRRTGLEPFLQAIRRIRA